MLHLSQSYNLCSFTLNVNRGALRERNMVAQNSNDVTNRWFYANIP